MTPLSRLDRRRDRGGDPPARHLRADPAAGGSGALRAALAADRPRHLRARRVARRPLGAFADAVGIAYPPSALFVLAAFFVLVVLLHYSTVISKLSDQNRILAQRLALLEQQARSSRPAADADGP